MIRRPEPRSLAHMFRGHESGAVKRHSEVTDIPDASQDMFKQANPRLRRCDEHLCALTGDIVCRD